LPAPRNLLVLGERGCIEIIDLNTLTLKGTIITREQVNKVILLADGKTLAVGQSFGII